MISIDRAVARNPHAGEPLRLPWSKLAEWATPRRGQVTMLFGPSGSCKSITILNAIIEWHLPTYVMSADTDQHDQAYRVMAKRHGLTTTAIEDGVRFGAYDLAELSDMREWLRWSFEPSPTLDDLDLDLMAFEEQFGAPPEVIVIDTISDLSVGDEDEYRALRRVMAAVHHVARVTGAAVFVLHHSTGEFDGELNPPPRRAINGKLSKVPELILSTAINGKHLGFAVVKQRSGFQDVRADNPIWLAVDAPRATVSDPPPATDTNWSN